MPEKIFIFDEALETSIHVNADAGAKAEIVLQRHVQDKEVLTIELSADDISVLITELKCACKRLEEQEE